VAFVRRSTGQPKDTAAEDGLQPKRVPADALRVHARLGAIGLTSVVLVGAALGQGPVSARAPVPVRGRSATPRIHDLADVPTEMTTRTARAGRSCSEKPLLPAYFYPGPTWQATLDDMAPGANVIVNPSSGPGSQFDPNYSRVVSAARDRGAKLWGYVDTKYTGVPLWSLATQVGDYRTWYGITNIFFDDVSSDASALDYYRSASDEVRGADHHASVMLNPGDYPASSYAALGDVIVVFEGDHSSFVAAKPPPWVKSHPASMFADLISAVPAADLRSVLTLARLRHSGYVYVTDHVEVSTLYEQLPSYWREELADTCATAGSPGTLRSTEKSTRPPGRFRTAKGYRPGSPGSAAIDPRRGSVWG